MYILGLTPMTPGFDPNDPRRTSMISNFKRKTEISFQIKWTSDLFFVLKSYPSKLLFYIINNFFSFVCRFNEHIKRGGVIVYFFNSVIDVPSIQFLCNLQT